jgi:hypothetical protein
MIFHDKGRGVYETSISFSRLAMHTVGNHGAFGLAWSWRLREQDGAGMAWHEQLGFGIME